MTGRTRAAARIARRAIRPATARRGVAVGVAVSILAVTGGCTDAAGGFERRGDVQEVADGLRDALGVEQIPADAHHRRSEPGCAAVLGLSDDDAWFERNTFSVGHTGLDPDQVYERTLDYLVGAGYEVQQLLAPLSSSRGLRAIRGDVGVFVGFVGDGANMTVTAGPCAVELTPIADRYEVVASTGG